MQGLISRLFSWMEAIPHDLIALIARICAGTVFFRSGMLKIEGWKDGSTLALFRQEYKLPIIPPEIAAYMATAAELTMPVLLFVGLFTRFAGLALLAMTLVIQIFVYPNAFDTHGVWAVCFLYLIKHGAGTFALDHLLEPRLRTVRA